MPVPENWGGNQPVGGWGSEEAHGWAEETTQSADQPGAVTDDQPAFDANEGSSPIFERLFEDKYFRPAALYIPSNDEDEQSTIAALFRTRTPCDLRVHLTFGRDQSCIDIRAAFDREQALQRTPSSTQVIGFKFRQSAVTQPEKLKFERITDSTQLPASLRTSRYEECVNDGHLYVLTLNYNPMAATIIGLHDQLEFANPRKLQCVDVLRRVPKNDQVQLFFNLQSETFPEILRFMVAKLKIERIIPPFHEYRSKRSGNIVVHYDNPNFGKPVDTHIRGALYRFRDIEQYSATLGIGEIREAASYLEATLETLETPMPASFVALPRTRKEKHSAMYLAFLQRDDEELIREVFNVGNSGVLSFDKPKPGIEPSGWRYTVKPPIPQCEYPGNLVLLIHRRKDDEREIRAEHVSKPKMRSQEV